MELTSKATEQDDPKPKTTLPIKPPPLSFQTYEDQKCVEKLTYLIIRPPRIKYDPKFIKNPSPSTHIMTTFQVPFDLTVYSPLEECRYCVLYLHGNSSCRMEGMNMLRQIPKNIALACFDFQGCGNGNQPWVTLGIKQSKQANAAAKFLQQKGYEVVGWGRSMGAASLLLSDLKVMVVDSAFSSLKQLCTTVAQTQVKWMPTCIFSCLFCCVYGLVRSDFRSKTSEQIDKLSIIDHLKQDPQGKKKCAIFITGDEDVVIDSSHSEKLFKAFKGHKDLLIFKGSHNSTRTPTVFNRCFQFLDQAVGLSRRYDQESSCQLKNIGNKEEQNFTTSLDELPKEGERMI